MRFDVNDIVGKTFGILTVLRFDHAVQRFYPDGRKRGFYYYYLCQCKCGNQIVLTRNNLLVDTNSSCGCLKKINPKDFIGKKFGYLTVLELVNIKVAATRGYIYHYLCKCSCGNECIVERGHLQSGHTQSCGCLHKKEFNSIKHKLSHTRLFSIWCDIKKRCSNPNHKYFKCYGGRKIKVCNNWKKDFITFYNWAISNGYQDDLSIDRIDVNGNYEPNNCRWVTPKEQARNKRNNNKLTYNGKTYCIAEWAEITGISQYTINSRLTRQWSTEKALTTPVRK